MISRKICTLASFNRLFAPSYVGRARDVIGRGIQEGSNQDIARLMPELIDEMKLLRRAIDRMPSGKL